MLRISFLTLGSFWLFVGVPVSVPRNSTLPACLAAAVAAAAIATALLKCGTRHHRVCGRRAVYHYGMGSCLSELLSFVLCSGEIHPVDLTSFPLAVIVYFSRLT